MATETAAPAAPAPAPVVGEDWKAMDADAFKARLQRERDAGLKEALKVAGVKSTDELQQRIASAKAIEDAQKTELQKAQDQAKALEGRAARADTLEKTLGKTAARELAALPEAVQKAVKDRAGDDPHAQLDHIEFLRSSGLLVAPAAEKRETKPSTTLAPSGPTPIKPGAPANAFEQWKALQGTNRTAAAHFYSNNRAAIEAHRPKSE